jgi:hypothetical protein
MGVADPIFYEKMKNHIFEFQKFLKKQTIN